MPYRGMTLSNALITRQLQINVLPAVFPQRFKISMLGFKFIRCFACLLESQYQAIDDRLKDEPGAGENQG